MTYIILTLCLASDPGKCWTDKHPLYDVSLMACMVHGQGEIPTLAERHPGAIVKRWKCERAE